MNIRFGMATVALLAIASAASAQTITAGNARFIFNSSTTVGSADLRTNAGTGNDGVFQNWWWFRVGAAAAETRFPWSTAGGNGVVGPADTLTKSMPGLGSGAFDAVMKYVITDPDGAGANNTANIVATMQITNTSGAPLTLAVFNYVDLDIPSVTSASGDSVAFAPQGSDGPNDRRMQVTDPAFPGQFGQFYGQNVSRFQAIAFTSIPGQLDNGTLTNLPNTGVPTTNFDMTGAYQWDLVIPAGGSATLLEAFSLNTIAVPEPATMALLALGGFLARRRR